jgi:hypothetical protein
MFTITDWGVLSIILIPVDLLVIAGYNTLKHIWSIRSENDSTDPDVRIGEDACKVVDPPGNANQLISLMREPDKRDASPSSE